MNDNFYADDDGNLYWDDDRSDSAEDWIYELRANGPTLDPITAYIKPGAAGRAINRAKFDKDLERILQQLGSDSSRFSIPPQISGGLYEFALRDLRIHAAYASSEAAVRSPECRQALNYIRQEIARFEKGRRMTRASRQIHCPSWVASWAQIWIDTFEEHEDLILGQLKAAERRLLSLMSFGRMGRSEIESHLLMIASGSIKRLTTGTPYARKRMLLLAAYAHASGLVPYKFSRTDDSEYIDLIKNRIHRARESKNRRIIWSTVLMIMSQLPSKHE